MATFTISAPATIIGATVSAIVYTTISTTGEVTAAVTGTGIEITGELLSYGTELVAGSMAGTTIRTISKTYGAAARPFISNTSRLGALGIAAVAGTSAALLTNALIYGGKKAGTYLHSCIEEYKHNYAISIQSEIPVDNIVETVEEDTLLITDEPVTHSRQDV